MGPIEALRDEGVGKWLALGATIVALEIIGHESLTHAVHRGLDTKIGKVAIPAAIAVTAAHFYDLIPHRYDPYYVIGGASTTKGRGQD